jgi:hypothetical protein
MQEIYGQGMNRFWTSLTVIFTPGITWAWAQSSSVLREDFTCASYKLPPIVDEWSSITCENDQQMFFTDQPIGYLYRYMGIDLTDVNLEVNALKLDGESDASIGLICRLKGNSFYAFLFFPESFSVAIYKYDRNGWDELSSRVLSQGTKINPSDTANRLRAECVGDKLTLFINKQPILTVWDDEFLSGDVGMIMTGNGSKRRPLKATFDDLEVFNAGQP